MGVEEWAGTTAMATARLGSELPELPELTGAFNHLVRACFEHWGCGEVGGGGRGSREHGSSRCHGGDGVVLGVTGAGIRSAGWVHGCCHGYGGFAGLVSGSLSGFGADQL